MEKEKRVGTFTLGLFLLVLGIATLISMILGLQIFRYVLMGWPVILISIGAEIIIYSTKNEAKLKYDIIGMFMIAIILGCTVIMASSSYILNELLFERNLDDLFFDKIETEIRSNM